jgi:hypothetical protein
MVRDPLTEATIDALQALWDDGNPLLFTGAIYEHLERSGQIARPASLVPTLDRLEDAGIISYSRGGPLDQEAIALHGGRFIDGVNPAIFNGP